MKPGGRPQAASTKPGHQGARTEAAAGASLAQRHPLRSFRRPLSRKSQAHKREDVYQRAAERPMTPAFSPTIFKPRMKPPLGTCSSPGTVPAPDAMSYGLLGKEAKRACHLPPGAGLGGAAGKVPPPRDRCFQKCLQVAHLQKNFNQKRQSIVFVFVFFFYQTEMLLISNLLILSILLVKGEEAAGMSLPVTPGLRKATRGQAGTAKRPLSPGCVQGRTRARSGGGRGHLPGNSGPTAPAGSPSSRNRDT